MTQLIWGWDSAPPTQGDYGNSNSWAIRAGLEALPREAGQNSVDARIDGDAELRFTIIRLVGDSKAAFEERLRWDGALSTHLGAMASGGQVVSDRIAAALHHHAEAEELLLLRVADYGCRGLTGPELCADGVPETDYGNFIKLCRLDLFSGKERAAGGSFGLGKAVYWRYSRSQTVLFNSNPSDDPAVTNRLFGVNQGTVHSVDRKRYRGKGWFGRPSAEGHIESVPADPATAQALHIDRADDRTGTSALVVGFHDPDDPSRDIEGLRSAIELGIEENFWPLISRGRMKFTVETVDHGSGSTSRTDVDPSGRFAELTHALQRFDSGTLDDRLEKVGDVVARDISIHVPKRRSAPEHEAFAHRARLVVTVSDDEADSLENKICLFRGAEMLVETIADEIPDTTFHAFLAAGLAVAPDEPTEELRRADEFLRLAEPPSHDHWIPSSSSGGHSLGPNYVPPYLPGLRAIRTQVRDALREIFGVTPKPDDRPPLAIARHLNILGAGQGGAEGRIKKPVATLTQWEIDANGAWSVELSVEMKAREEGWMFRPELVFVGADARMQPVDWAEIEVLDGCRLEGPDAVVEGKPRGRSRCRLRGITDPASHPIPASLSAIDVRAAAPRVAPTAEEAS